MNYYLDLWGFKVKKSQRHILTFTIEPYGRNFRAGEYQVHIMADDRPWIFWQLGLLTNEYLDKPNCVKSRLLQANEISLLEALLNLELPLISKCYFSYIKDCGSTSLFIYRDNETIKMEGNRVLPSQWKCFVDFANVVADNCGNHVHNHTLFIDR